MPSPLERTIFMGRSHIVVFNRGSIKSIHDTLIRAWEDGDSEQFNRATQEIAATIEAVPRKKYGGRRVYENDGNKQPAWMVVKYPSDDVECID